ncbi:hypothetical protein ACOSP7_032780 [Xanthoceras sorbifolium]
MQDGHPIAFESRKLNDTERRYTVQEKEMTAVVHCLRTWRHYLLGSHFIIRTDNVATSYFQTQKTLSPKQARWQDFLAEFDYTLEYKSGKANLVADALSRNVTPPDPTQPDRTGERYSDFQNFSKLHFTFQNHCEPIKQFRNPFQVSP